MQSNQRLYKIKWQSKLNKDCKGEGQPQPIRELAIALAYKMNKKYPDIEHWVETVEEGDR